jgi:hypothetical protein
MIQVIQMGAFLSRFVANNGANAIKKKKSLAMNGKSKEPAPFHCKRYLLIIKSNFMSEKTKELTGKTYNPEKAGYENMRQAYENAPKTKVDAMIKYATNKAMQQAPDPISNVISNGLGKQGNRDKYIGGMTKATNEIKDIAAKIEAIIKAGGKPVGSWVMMEEKFNINRVSIKRR